MDVSIDPCVVVVGAGFGGLTLARVLRKAPVEVLLIDRHNYHTFQPLLYQVATAGLEPEEIAHAVRGIFQQQKNFRFRLGAVVGVDWEEKVVLLDDGSRVPYDYLVLAAGVGTTYFGIEGAEEYSFPLKSLSEAVRLRGHIIRQFELADQDAALIEQGVLHFVVVGGGPTGVEMAGALVELFQKVLRKDFPHLPVDQARVILVEAASHLLGAFHPASQVYALEKLAKRGVEVRLGEPVVRATDHAVYLGGGDVIPTRTLIWAAGVHTHRLAEALELEQTRGGRIVVGEDLSVPGYPNVFVIGDMAGSRDEEGHLHPQLAPVAMQGARHVARQIRRRLTDQPSTAFRYRDKGIMATIGRNAAVAKLAFGPRTSGFVAWVMWLLLHLVLLIGFRNRLNVLVNWAWNYMTYDRSARLIMPTEQEVNPGSSIPVVESDVGDAALEAR
ncbi:MAG: NAD(P)/FAD-dependent oxidoreductase [Rhodothermales bacterium]